MQQNSAASPIFLERRLGLRHAEFGLGATAAARTQSEIVLLSLGLRPRENLGAYRFVIDRQFRLRLDTDRHRRRDKGRERCGSRLFAHIARLVPLIARGVVMARGTVAAVRRAGTPIAALAVVAGTILAVRSP